MTFEQEPVTAGLSIKKTPLQQGIYLLDYGGFRNGTYESVDRRTSLEEYKRRNVPDAIFAISSEISSTTGESILHGPHHVAQKSTITSLSEEIISLKLVSLTTIAIILSPYLYINFRYILIFIIYNRTGLQFRTKCPLSPLRKAGFLKRQTFQGAKIIK